MASREAGMSARAGRRSAARPWRRRSRSSCARWRRPGGVATGIGFLDHMLGALARHARFDLTLRCQGDLEIDDHHTVEDCGLALGQALDQALGERRGIARFGSAYAPLDEALRAPWWTCPAGRASWSSLASRETLGGLACENVAHFFSRLRPPGAWRCTSTCCAAPTTTTAPRRRSRPRRWRCARRCASMARIEVPSTKGVL